MPPVTLVILADDLTGATDAALAFTKLGARTDVWLERPRTLADADVAAIDLDTRTLPPAQAQTRVRAVLHDLPPEVKLVKKIDSTLRGNIAAETEALLAERENAIALVVPAHPKNGRVQRGGVLFVDGTPVADTPFGRDLFAPVRSSDVRRHLPDCGNAVIAAPSLLGGGGALAREIDSAVRAGARAIAIDAETEDDFAAIAALERGDGRYVWVGSAGLLEALAPRLLRERLAAASGAFVGSAAAVRPLLFVIGSVSDMTRLQIARFAENGVTEMIDPRTVLIDEGGSRSKASTERIENALAAGSDVLVALSSDRVDVEAALSMGRLHGFDGPTTSRELRERFVELVAPALPKAGTVVLSGADIARTFLRTVGVEGIRLVGEAVPDVPLARALERDLSVVAKAGGAGTPDTYRAIARAALQPMARSEALERPRADRGA
jgi:uncharacterized protein YgbK (DUF1537 family)